MGCWVPAFWEIHKYPNVKKNCDGHIAQNFQLWSCTKTRVFWVGCYDWIFFIRNLPNTKSGTRNYAAEMVQLNDSMTWETVCEVILLRKATSNFYTLLWDFSGQACRDNLLADSIWPITVFVLIQWEEEVRLTFSNAQEAWRQWCWKTGGIVRGSENLHFRRP